MIYVIGPRPCRSGGTGVEPQLSRKASLHGALPNIRAASETKGFFFFCSGCCRQLLRGMTVNPRSCATEEKPGRSPKGVRGLPCVMPTAPALLRQSAILICGLHHRRVERGRKTGARCTSWHPQVSKSARDGPEFSDSFHLNEVTDRHTPFSRISATRLTDLVSR